MQGVRGFPPLEQNEQTNAQVEHADEFQKTAQGKGVGLRDGDYGGGDGFPVPAEFIGELRAGLRAEQLLGDVGFLPYRLAVDAEQSVARADAGQVARRVLPNNAGKHALLRIQLPVNPVVGTHVAGALLEIDAGEDHRRQRDQEKNHCQRLQLEFPLPTLL